MNPNKEFHELLGKHWHEWSSDGGRKFSDWRSYTCAVCEQSIETPSEPDGGPDYAADPRLVLKAMKEYCDDEYRFAQFLFSLPIHGTYTILLSEFIDLILDKTGRLRDISIGWMERREK